MPAFWPARTQCGSDEDSSMPATNSRFEGSAPERTTTGIPGMDEVLGGGLPKGHLYLVEGESGA